MSEVGRSKSKYVLVYDASTRKHVTPTWNTESRHLDAPCFSLLPGTPL